MGMRVDGARHHHAALEVVGLVDARIGRGRGDDPPGDDGTAPGRSEDPGQGADRCGVDDLVPGATVKLAELVLTNGNAFFRLVGLAGQAPAAAPQPGAGEEAPAAG